MSPRRFAVPTCLFVAALFWSSPSPAASGDGAPEQSAESTSSMQISTDRPGAGNGSSIVPRNHLQLETGFNGEFAGDATNVNLGNTLFRFGLARWAEARLSATPVGIFSSAGVGTDVQPLTDVSLGAKFGTEAGRDAAIAFLPSATVLSPTEGADWNAGGSVIADVATSQAVSMSLNLGGTAVPADGGRGVELFGSLSGSASLTDAAGSFLEVYTIVPPGGTPQNYVDGGVTYRLGDRFQLDGWFGFEVDVDGTRFAGVGASYLL